MAKPARRSKASAATSGQERNLVERLLVECVLPERRVPAESGVRFHIACPSGSRSVCLIFHVDLPQNPLITEGRRPDYLVAHASKDEVLFTIIEMKGRSSDELKKGVEQIEAFEERLRREIKEHLPQRLRPHYQGILLMAHGAHPPLKKIADARLEIAALSYHHSADLYTYVNRKITKEDRYRHREAVRDGGLSDLEHLIVHGKETSRRRDALHDARAPAGSPGIYVNYSRATSTPKKSALPSPEYCALVASPTDSFIAVPASATDLKAMLTHELEVGLGLSPKRRDLRVEDIT